MLLVERQPIYMEIDARHIFNADFSYPCPTSLFFLPSPSTSPSPLVNLKNSLENVGLAERWGQKSMPPGMSIKMRISIVVPDTETEDYFGPAAPIFAPRIANFTGLPFFSLAPMTRPISDHAHIHCLGRIIFEQITWQKVVLPWVKLLSGKTVKCSKPIQWRKCLKIEIEKRRKKRPKTNEVSKK